MTVGVFYCPAVRQPPESLPDLPHFLSPPGATRFSVYGAMRFRTAPAIGEPGWADGKGTDATHSRARETRRQNAPWAQPSLGCVSKIETGGNMNEGNKIS